MNYIKLTVVIFIVLFNFNTANASDIETQEKALKIILEFANGICNSIPLTGEKKNIEVEGKANAELSKMLKKVVDLGIEGSAKYQSGEYKGLLQADLRGALKESTNCKLKVFTDLEEKLGLKTPAIKASKPKPPTTVKTPSKTVEIPKSPEIKAPNSTEKAPESKINIINGDNNIKPSFEKNGIVIYNQNTPINAPINVPINAPITIQ